MKLLEISPLYSLSVDPDKVVSVAAIPSQKLLFGNIPSKIIVTMENGKDYNLSVTQKGANIDLLYKEMVNRINEARQEKKNGSKGDSKKR